ncbi:MAG TPA: 3-isopropylmalate dehydratase small subunit [Synergistaceae bacterium]|uniref:3-isopropylmalate dehydratase small subunit n=1 Tax=Synergistaceae TaxID=649777 RepID=UPI000EB8CA51|nr:3-isopropylmalate dehydratase small subunit [Synergistaceae bacterium DZ-S4]HAH68919.1 3-isopropylmalate dehydratase small subunit [Synergistaceae bacterium]
METTLKGKAWVYGDNVDTDVIIPARYLVTSDERSLAAHCMEDIDASYAGGVLKGDMIVAGNNFGCGSSREHAPIAIKGSGASCVIAKSFARIFYRNAINIGLPILECTETGRITKDDIIEVDLAKGTITNRTKGETYNAKPFPDFLQNLIGLGGLVPYVRARLSE